MIAFKYLLIIPSHTELLASHKINCKFEVDIGYFQCIHSLPSTR